MLDAFGPLEMFALRNTLVPNSYEIVYISGSDYADDNMLTVQSSGGPKIAANYNLITCPSLDLLCIPGGQGTRNEVNNKPLLDWIKMKGLESGSIMTICTGSALLAKTGLLDGLKATSNKYALKSFVIPQGPKVNWQPTARWVYDVHIETGTKIWTSSGISAGTDLSLAMISQHFGHDSAKDVADRAEYVWNEDPDNDPFSYQVNMADLDTK